MKYFVSFYYQESGTTEVEADTPKQAEQKIYAHLDEYGLDSLHFKTTDRDYGTTDAEVA